MNYRVIQPGWNCGPWVLRSMESVRQQSIKTFTSIVCDDASDDDTGEIVQEYCERHGWPYFINRENKGTLYNQVRMIRAICDDPEDVIVFVDADDYLAHDGVFEVLDRYYATGIDMSYGSYQSVPFSHTCPPALPYPPEVVRDNSYRVFARSGRVWVNHLRTLKYKLFLEMEDRDFQDAHGAWLRSAGDSAMMFPALELSNGRWAFIPEVLYKYNSENANSDWRRWPRNVDAGNHRVLWELPAKQPLP